MKLYQEDWNYYQLICKVKPLYNSNLGNIKESQRLELENIFINKSKYNNNNKIYNNNNTKEEKTYLGNIKESQRLELEKTDKVCKVKISFSLYTPRHLKIAID